MNVLILLIADFVVMVDAYQETLKELIAQETVLIIGSSMILPNVLEKLILENSLMLLLKLHI